jgi:hypothetical protein
MMGDDIYSFYEWFCNKRGVNESQVMLKLMTEYRDDCEKERNDKETA